MPKITIKVEAVSKSMTLVKRIFTTPDDQIDALIVIAMIITSIMATAAIIDIIMSIRSAIIFKQQWTADFGEGISAILGTPSAMIGALGALSAWRVRTNINSNLMAMKAKKEMQE